ncbi:thiol-disulfide oxidoreductase DCC family protein [Prosthecobacter sp. SYSU 5D2]|uniref:thiol-disulfide oxidoreductase DCC family protein n=1 Tax=Prosthecobacter sp. SYSU 5D2 TaxID=3134134 RepID=UPI0031FE7BFA
MTAQAQFPTHIWLFDGVCNLCHEGVQFVLKHDRQGLIHFASIQSEAGRKLYSEHGLDPDAPDTMLFITPDGAFRESDAALELAAYLGGLWSLTRIFKIIPRPLRDRAYLFIARHRYQWFGKKDACPLPRPEWRDRFLD